MTKVDPHAPITSEVLEEAVQAILSGIDGLFSGFRQEFYASRQEFTDFSQEANNHFDTPEASQSKLREQVKQLKNTTPTRGGFEELKARVNKYHPLVG